MPDTSRAVLANARVATMRKGGATYGLIENGAIAIDGGHIVWCGDGLAVPADHAGWSRVDLGGRLVTPALIDCHTHLVFGGNRASEFERRLQGVSYEQIAREGGGIMATVNATRAASKEQLFSDAVRRADALIAEGAGTIEIKSGYGLTIADELKMLRVARRIGRRRPLRVLTTYLGAHAVPPEYAGNAGAYISEVVLPGLEAARAEDLVDAVDGFCERIAFTPEQIEMVFRHAGSMGLPVKLHAEQLSNSGGASLAAKYRALSADHLEYLDARGVADMAEAGTTAVLLPGAFYTLRESQAPPVDLLRQSGVPIAIATDCNPGSSPLYSLLLAMNMAAVLFRLTPEETLAGTTREAARALNLPDAGIVGAGMRADLAVWDAEHPAELVYRIGSNPLAVRIFAGDLSAVEELC